MEKGRGRGGGSGHIRVFSPCLGKRKNILEGVRNAASASQSRAITLPSPVPLPLLSLPPPPLVPFFSVLGELVSYFVVVRNNDFFADFADDQLVAGPLGRKVVRGRHHHSWKLKLIHLFMARTHARCKA